MSNDHPHYVRPEDRARPEDPSVFVRTPPREVLAEVSSHADDLEERLRNREAFDGLLRFVEQQGGSMEITNGRWNDGRTWWQVAVRWYSIGSGDRKVYAEDASFDEACLMCRGLLAHSLASGVATP